MTQTAVLFIDGGYLDKVLKQAGLTPNIDYLAFVRAVSSGLDIEKVYYYHCLPNEKPNPTMAERDYYNRRQEFFNNLEKLPGFEVRYGKLQYRGDDDRGRPIYVQKQVDLWLGLDMAFTAFKHQADMIILFTGDSDFLPAVEMVKGEGVVFKLCYSPLCPASEELKRAANVIQSMEKGDFTVLTYKPSKPKPIPQKEKDLPWHMFLDQYDPPKKQSYTGMTVPIKESIGDTNIKRSKNLKGK